jgi:hypothetical protein
MTDHSPSPADRTAEGPRDVCRRCQFPKWVHDLWTCVPVHMAAYAEDEDMRREVVLRELNQGALAGMSSDVSEHAADLVLAALNHFDEWRGGRTGKVEQHAAEVARCMDENERLSARVGELEGQLARFVAQHQPYDNLFKTCRTCKDGYGEPLPWPCADAKALSLGEVSTDDQ